MSIMLVLHDVEQDVTFIDLMRYYVHYVDLMKHYVHYVGSTSIIELGIMSINLV